MDITFDIFNSCYTHHSDASGIFCSDYVHTEREAKYRDTSDEVIPHLQQEHSRCRRSSADRREWFKLNADNDYGVSYYEQADDIDDSLKTYKVQYCRCPNTFEMTIGNVSYKSALNVFKIGDILEYKNTQRCTIAPNVYRRLLEKIPTLKQYMQTLPTSHTPSHFQSVAFLGRLKKEIANRLYEVSDEMFDQSEQVKRLAQTIVEILRDPELDSRLLLAYSTGKMGDLAIKLTIMDMDSPTDEQRERLVKMYELIALSKLYDMLADVDATSVLRFSAKPSPPQHQKCVGAENLIRMYVESAPK